MPQDLTGKVVAVTGGASGMGAAIATMLAQRGASVSIADVQEAALGAIKNTLLAGGNTNVLTTVVDVRDEAAVDAWIAATVARFGRLDGAANFAGVIPRNFGRSSVRDQETADWDYVLSVNLTGLMYCMRAQLRVMAARGSIVNAASISGLFGYPNNASYGAAKFGVVGLTKCAAKEAGPDKAIRVNCIAPGIIATPMYDRIQEIRGAPLPKEPLQIKRDGTPEEVAALVCWLLGDESQYITGTVQLIDGGWLC